MIDLLQTLTDILLDPAFVAAFEFFSALLNFVSFGTLIQGIFGLFF